MINVKPHVRSVGQGPSVVLLHSSASSGRQWDPLVSALSSRFRLHAVDLHGHGGTPSWLADRPMQLEDDAALVAPLLAAPGGVHLVGHSYGGGLALKLAAMHPDKVKSVAVFEPVLFRLLFDYHRRDRAASEIVIVARRIRQWLAIGQAERSAQCFVDFWSGTGSWDAMPLPHQQVIAARMPSIVSHFHALFNDSLTRADLSALELPVLSLTGAKTRAATRRIGELLRFSMPGKTHEMLAGVGHMGPVTHPTPVIARIAEFFEEHALRKDAIGLMAEAA
jgi:pimeloyl-ACP methyl ester carboxylesterase